METEMLRLWNIVSDIVEQLNQNKLNTSKLQSQAGQLHEQAGQVSNEATLRRFNTDLSKESFTSELERLSAALIMENQSLLHENKQLSMLLQEYEKTLQTVMEKFKGHCVAAQTHQLTLTSHYETLLSRDRGEETSAGARMMMDAGEHFHSLSSSVVRVLRSMEGKDPHQEERETQERVETDDEADEEADTDAEAEEHDEVEEVEATEEEEQGMGDWVEEREVEIQRLDQENRELRRMLGISPEQERELGLEEDDRYSPTTPTPSPFAARRHPFSPGGSSIGSFRDDRGRGSGGIGGGGRAALGLGLGGEQRRSGLFGRGGYEGEDLRMRPAVPERVLSPPNEIRWLREASAGPLVESI